MSLTSSPPLSSRVSSAANAARARRRRALSDGPAATSTAGGRTAPALPPALIARTVPSLVTSMLSMSPKWAYTMATANG
eukprot:6995294-Prymnesium_polylepis.1